jgi:hypothetical protein
VSRVVGTVAKVVILIAVIVGATFMFRKDTRRALTEHWAMEKCPGEVEADVRLIIPWSEPKVGRCEGTPARATCALETTEKSGRKTAPLKDWDCSQRHISDRFGKELMRMTMRRMSGNVNTTLEQEHMEDVQREFLQSIRYVTERLRERRELLGEPDPYPAGLFGVDR